MLTKCTFICKFREWYIQTIPMPLFIFSEVMYNSIVRTLNCIHFVFLKYFLKNFTQTYYSCSNICTKVNKHVVITLAY